MSRRKRRKAAGRGVKQPSQLASRNGVRVAVYGDDRGTAERHRRGEVEVVDTYQDNTRARAARAVDTIGRMLANKTIGPEMEAAARRFQEDFALARLDALHAAPLERRIAGRADETVVLAARERTGRAMAALGGHGAPAGAAVWFVLGCGHTIAEWARRERLGHGRSLNPHCARGILIGALSALAAHWRIKA